MFRSSEASQNNWIGEYALTTDESSRASVRIVLMDIQQEQVNCLGAAASLYKLLRKVFMRRREEDDLSAVTLVTGNARTSLSA